MSSEYLDYALAYAALGIAVFPCHSVTPEGLCTCGNRKPGHGAGKHPRTINGYRAATTDAEQIRQWWTVWPTANIGAAMEQSNLVGVDVDPRNGGDESWHELRRELGEMPDTWTSLTGGGGFHEFFRPPAGFSTQVDQIAPGVDVKWKGYTVLPPSLHASGRRYEWDYAPGDVPVAPLPEGLRRRLVERQASTPDGERVPVAALMAQDCADGSRNVTLTRIAGYLRNELPEAATEALCQAWNEAHCKPPMDADEVTRTVHGLYLLYQAPATVTFGVTPEPRADGRHYEMVPAPVYITRPRLRALVPGLLYENSAFICYGPPGSYKSFFVLDLMASLAAGVEFHRMPVKQGPALYVAGEGAGGIAKRLKAWQQVRGPLSPDLHILPGVVPLLNADAVLRLVEDVRSFGVPFTAIVFDTLSRAIAGADENAQKEMSLAMDALGALQRELGCAVGVVHHGRKADGNLRGSGVLDGAFDTIWKVVSDTRVTVTCEKQKDSELFKPMLFETVVVPLGAAVEPSRDSDGFWVGGQEESVVLRRLDTSEEVREQHRARLEKLTTAQKDTLRALDAFSPTGATYREWGRRARVEEEGGPSRQAFKERVRSLIEKHKMVEIPAVRDGEAVYIVDGLYQGMLATMSERMDQA